MSNNHELSPVEQELHALISIYDGSVPFPDFVASHMEGHPERFDPHIVKRAQDIMLVNDPRYVPVEPSIEVLDEINRKSWSLIPEPEQKSIPQATLEALQAIQQTLEAMYAQERDWIAQCRAWHEEDKAVSDARYAETQTQWLAHDRRENDYLTIAKERLNSEQAAQEATMTMYQQWRREDVERVQAHYHQAIEAMMHQRPLVLNEAIREECERVGQAVLEGKASLARYLQKD